MTEAFTLKKDGKKCKIKIIEKSNGIKMKTEGKDCKKLLGKDYFKDIEMGVED